MGSVSENIQKRLDELGMSWSQLARKADVSQPTIFKLRNTEENVTVATLQKIADALGVEVPELLD